MRCPECGAENAEGKKFCVQCGHPLSIPEPAVEKPKRKFCRYCGADLQGKAFCTRCGKSNDAEPVEPVEPVEPLPASEMPLSVVAQNPSEFCKICGATYGAGAFCTSCGKSIVPGTAKIEPEEVATGSEQKSRKSLWIVLALVVLAAIAAGAYFLLFAGKSSQKTSLPGMTTSSTASVAPTASARSAEVPAATTKSPSISTGGASSTVSVPVVAAPKSSREAASVVTTKRPPVPVEAVPQPTTPIRPAEHHPAMAPSYAPQPRVEPKRQGVSPEQMQKLLSPFGGND